MEIKNSDELSKIIDLCRKKGVETFKLDGLEMKLTAEAPESVYKLNKKLEQLAKTPDPIENIIEEQEKALFWSVQLPSPDEGSSH